MRKRVKMLFITLAAVLFLGIVGAEPSRASHSLFASGDIFVAVSNGQVQWRHPDGTINRTLSTGLGTHFTTGMTFDVSGRLYVTGFNTNAVSVFNADGSPHGTFGSGYNADPESIVFDAAGNAYVGQADGTRDILKFDSAGNILASFDVVTGPRGSDWIELESDQCTLRYTSEGKTIKRFNVCTNMQLPDFTSALRGPSFALRTLPDGSTLVADNQDIHRLDSRGNIIHTYDASGENCWFALTLDPDGASFWAADFCTANVYKFSIVSGQQLLQFNTGTGPNTVFGIAVNTRSTAAVSSAHVPTSGILTQDFSFPARCRVDNRQTGCHSGLDIASAARNPTELVRAILAGKVIRASCVSGYGWSVVIDHGDLGDGRHLFSLYAHMGQGDGFADRDDCDIPNADEGFIFVKQGDIVAAGDAIGRQGNSGTASGPGGGIHLHFSMNASPTYAPAVGLIDPKRCIGEPPYIGNEVRNTGTCP